MLKTTPQMEDTKIIDTFRALSNKVSLRIFNLIEKSGEWTVNGDLATVAGTTKIYYGAIVRLLNAGLVKRWKGKLYLTTYGKLIAKSTRMMANVTLEQQMLKVLDIIGKPDMPREEYKDFVGRIIVDEQVREMLLS